jgi:hypothetical protein
VTIVVAALATLAVGYYVAWREFTDLLWMALATQVVSILVAMRYFKSSQLNGDTLSTLGETTSLLPSSTDTTATEVKELSSSPSTKYGHFFEVFTVFRFKNRPRKKSINLLATLVAYMFWSFMNAVFNIFVLMLLNTPFCWSSNEIGIYYAINYISTAILGFIGMQILTRLGVSDAVICAFSNLFYAGYCLWLAFARHNWELYVGLLIYSFSSYQGSLTTSMMSKWLKLHEISKAFVAITAVNTIVGKIAGSFFIWFYARTVINHRNFSMLLAAGLCVVPFILNM